MIYRDDGLARLERVTHLRREIARLSGHPQVTVARSLRERLHRERQSCDRVGRTIARLRRPAWRLVPRSATELAIACALSFAAVTLALGLAFTVLCVASVV